MKSYLELEIINGQQALDKISLDWNELTNKIEKKRFFHRVEYYKAYLDTMEKNLESIYFFILKDRDKVVAIFPFRRIFWRFGPLSIKVLESVQNSDIQLVQLEYDFIMEKREDSGIIFQALLDNLRQLPEGQWDLISIRNILEDSYAFNALNSISGMKKQCTFLMKSFYLATNSYEKIIQNTSGNFRRSLKRANRKLSNLGPSLFISLGEVHQIEKAFINFLNLEGSGWKQELGTAIIQHNDATHYYKSLVNHFLNINCCEFHELKLNDQTIASFFTLNDDYACYLPKIGYDVHFEELSPGKLLFNYLIKRCCDMHQTKELIFLSNASHLEHWKPQHYEKLNYYLFNNNLQGNIIYIFKILRDAIRPHDYRLMPYYKFIKIDPLKKIISILK